GARSDDRARHARTAEQPREGGLARVEAPPGEQVLVALDLLAGPGVGQRVRGPPRGAARAAALLLLADRAAQQAPVERGPGDDAQSVLLRGRDDVHLGAAFGQVVQALLTDQAVCA